MERTSLSSLESTAPGVAGMGVDRWASLAAATALMAYGVSHRHETSGRYLAVAAAPLAYHGLVGRWPLRNGRAVRDDTRVALGGERGVHVRESIRLETPVNDVFRFFRRLDQLPRFMTHLERVTPIDEGHSHWVAKVRGGVTVEWDAEIINEVENALIAWRSLPGADVVSAGSVTFSTVRAGRSTQVSVNLQYAPPAGRLGAGIAMLLGREPSQTIREDLRHLKQLLETGEIPRAQPRGRR